MSKEEANPKWQKDVFSKTILAKKRTGILEPLSSQKEANVVNKEKFSIKLNMEYSEKGTPVVIKEE